MVGGKGLQRDMKELFRVVNVFTIVADMFNTIIEKIAGKTERQVAEHYNLIFAREFVHIV